MPKLSSIPATSDPQSVIVYGGPKSGKTELVGHLAAKFNLHWVDLENGGATLRKLPSEYQDRINYLKVYDTKDSPNAVDTCLKLMTGAKTKVCVTHGKVMCAVCARQSQPFEEWELGALDTKSDIVVFDSFTQLTSSANAHATRNLDRDKGQNEEFSHWRYQGTLLEKFLDLAQNAPFHVVVIAHEMGIDQEDGGEKVMPAGGTKNFARSVAKYFGHIIYCSVTNRAHKAISATTSANRILAGSRLDVDVSGSPQEQLLKIFDGSVKPKTETQKPAAAAAGLLQKAQQRTGR